MPIGQTLRKRLLSSAVLIAVTLTTIFMAPHWLFFLVIEIFGLLGLNEFLAMAEKKNLPIHRPLALFFGALVPFAMVYSWESFLIAAMTLVLFVVSFNKKLRETALLSTAVTVFGIIYIPFLFSHTLKIHMLENGPQWIFYTILMVKGGDAGAYFVGRKYGKIKLIEHVSPNKSVEGAIGGFATSLLLSLLSKLFLPEVPLIHLFILGSVIGIISQLGDLAESLIKRDVGMKDSGQIPGLGGIMDVLDSLIFTVPFVYYYVISVVRG